MPLPECFNCEAKRLVREAHDAWRAEVNSATPKLVQMPERVADSLVTLGVVASPTLYVPLARGAAQFAGLRAKVFLCASWVFKSPTLTTHPPTTHHSPLTTHHTHPGSPIPTCRLPDSIRAELSPSELSAVRAAPYDKFLCPTGSCRLERGVHLHQLCHSIHTSNHALCFFA